MDTDEARPDDDLARDEATPQPFARSPFPRRHRRAAAACERSARARRRCKHAYELWQRHHPFRRSLRSSMLIREILRDPKAGAQRLSEHGSFRDFVASIEEERRPRCSRPPVDGGGERHLLHELAIVRAGLRIAGAPGVTGARRPRTSARRRPGRRAHRAHRVAKGSAPPTDSPEPPPRGSGDGPHPRDAFALVAASGGAQ